MKLNFLTLLTNLLFIYLVVPNLVSANSEHSNIEPKEASLKSLTLLMDFIDQGDIRQSKRQIESINSSHKELINQERLGETPLSKAAKLGHLKIVKQLLKAGASIDKAPSSTITPLMKAAYYGHIEVVELLLQQGADIRLEHQGGYEAFDWALESGRHKIMNVLIERLILKVNSAILK